MTALAVALLAVLPASAPAAAADPALSVPQAQLDAALTCPDTFDSAREPVLLVHGTGANSAENWSWNYGKVLPELGYDVCAVDLPNRALDDIQVSTEYVVHAILTMAERSGRKVDVMGHSQGGLQPRWAVRWWDAARAAVDDLVALATPNHGTLAADTACAGVECPGAAHQMKQGSAFLAALNSPDETPGDVSYTSVYSLTDELVQPAAPEPTAALEGASNIAIQDLCPGRVGEHAAMAADAVAYEMVIDAFTEPGPADPARFDPLTCAKTSFDGVTAGPMLDLALDELENGRFPDYRPLAEEPPLAPYARPPAPAPDQPAAQPAAPTTGPTAGSGSAPQSSPALELPRTGGLSSLLLSGLLSAGGLAGIAVRRRL